MAIRRLLCLILSLALLGCAGSGTERGRATQLAPQQLDLATDANIAWPTATWWNELGDAQLSALIEQARSGHPSLRIAQARVELARATARGQRAAQQPYISLDAELRRERFSENDIYPPPIGGSVQNNASTLLDFSYEFDFWGRQRAALAAALNHVEAANAERSAADLVLSIAVAQTYFELQHAWIEQKLASAAVEQREALLTLTHSQIARGLVRGAEIDFAQAALANARRDSSDAQLQADITLHQLAALCGISTAQLPTLQHLETSPMAIESPARIPADLLGRRADIAAQRQRVDAEAHRIDVAQAEFYPNVDLSGFFGLRSVDTGQLFTGGSSTWGIGPALHLPLFNRDVLRAELGGRQANYDLAVEQYNQTVLTAVRETADAGSRVQALKMQRADIEMAEQALQRTHAIAELRYRRGLGNRIDVINTQLALLQQQRRTADVRTQQTQAQLSLIKALGGGYADTVTN